MFHTLHYMQWPYPSIHELEGNKQQHGLIPSEEFVFVDTLHYSGMFQHYGHKSPWIVCHWENAIMQTVFTKAHAEVNGGYLLPV